LATDDDAPPRSEAVRRSYRTASLPPCVGIDGAAEILDADRTTIYRWIRPGSDAEATKHALGLLEATGVITPAEAEVCTDPKSPGDTKMAAVAALIADLRERRGNQKAAEMLLDCTYLIRPARLDGPDGRQFWAREDVERFAAAKGRIRAKAGQAKAPR
jgi:hypothetical protein